MTGVQETMLCFGQSKMLLLCILALVVVKTVKSDDIELWQLFGHSRRNNSNKIGNIGTSKCEFNSSTEADVNHSTARDVEKTKTILEVGNTGRSTPTERTAELVMEEANIVDSPKSLKHGRVKRRVESSQSLTIGEIDRMVSEAAEKALLNRPNEASMQDESEQHLNEVDPGQPVEKRYSDVNSLAVGTPMSGTDSSKSGANNYLIQLMNSETPIATPVQERKFPDLSGYKDITLRDPSDEDLEKRRITTFNYRKIPGCKHRRHARGRIGVGSSTFIAPYYWSGEDVDVANMQPPILQQVYDPSSKGKETKKSKTSMETDDFNPKFEKNYFLWVTLPSMIGIVSIIFIVCIFTDPEGKRYDIPPDLANLKMEEEEHSSESDKETADDNDETVVKEELTFKPQECTGTTTHEE